MFGRGFEAFGKAVPIRGAGPRMGGAPPPPPPPPAPMETEQVAPAHPQMAQPQQQRPTPPGRIPVYKKGDPNAPPCPICH